MMPSQTIVPVFDDVPSSLCLLFTVMYMLPFALSKASCQRAPDNVSNQCTMHNSVRSQGQTRKGASPRRKQTYAGKGHEGCATKGTSQKAYTEAHHEGYVTKGTNKGDATQVTQHAKNSSPHAIYRKGYATHDAS